MKCVQIRFPTVWKRCINKTGYKTVYVEALKEYGYPVPEYFFCFIIGKFGCTRESYNILVKYYIAISRFF